MNFHTLLSAALSSGLLGGLVGGAVHRTLTSKKMRDLEAKFDKAIDAQPGSVEDIVDQAEPVIDQAAVSAATKAGEKVISSK